MEIPKGLTEEEVLDVIASTVSYLAPSFKFGYYDIDDMKQEGAIFCFDALPSFNFEKSSQTNVKDALLTFLKTHVRWRFLNMRRKYLIRLEPPSCNCELCKTDSHNRLDCKKYSSWVRRNVSKKSLMEPFDVDSVHNTEASTTSDVTIQIFSSDIIKILNREIPANIRADYRRFLEGVSLTKNKKDKLFEKIREILTHNYSKDLWCDNEDRPSQ